jgi:hypothetical protein
VEVPARHGIGEECQRNTPRHTGQIGKGLQGVTEIGNRIRKRENKYKEDPKSIGLGNGPEKRERLGKVPRGSEHRWSRSGVSERGKFTTPGFC